MEIGQARASIAQYLIWARLRAAMLVRLIFVLARFKGQCPIYTIFLTNLGT